MKLQPARTDLWNAFSAYGEGYVSVNAIRYSANLLVLPDRLVENWTRASFETLSAEDFAFLAALESEIVLLGTGDQLRFPRPELMQPLMLARKGLEVMDIQAACRTYNVLAGEGRKVAAALIFC